MTPPHFWFRPCQISPPLSLSLPNPANTPEHNAINIEPFHSALTRSLESALAVHARKHSHEHALEYFGDKSRMSAAETRVSRLRSRRTRQRMCTRTPIKRMYQLQSGPQRRAKSAALFKRLSRLDGNVSHISYSYSTYTRSRVSALSCGSVVS